MAALAAVKTYEVSACVLGKRQAEDRVQNAVCGEAKVEITQDGRPVRLLLIAVKAYTDSAGTTEFTRFFPKRAAAVSDQGLDAGTRRRRAHEQVADNSTAQGRQKNQRVKIVVPGKVIGAHIGGRS